MLHLADQAATITLNESCESSLRVVFQGHTPGAENAIKQNAADFEGSSSCG